MQTMVNGYNGATVLFVLNRDRIFTAGTVVVGLLAGAFLGTTLTGQ